MLYVQELAKIGLTLAESKIYSALLQSGDNTASTLAKKTGLGRTNIYEYAKLLGKKGLISEYEKNNKIFFKAEDPAQLQELVESRIRETKDLSLTLGQILPKMNNLFKASTNMPLVKNVIGSKGYKEIFDKLYFSSQDCDIYYIIPDLDFYEPPEPQYRNMINRNHIFTFLFANRAKNLTEFNKRDERENRSTKIIDPQRFKITSDLLLFDDFLVFGNLGKKNFRATVIKDEQFCKLFLTLLKFTAGI